MTRVPVVAGLAYREALGRLTERFAATLATASGNPYNRDAVGVSAGGARIGFLPPEIARHAAAEVRAREDAGAPLEVPAALERGGGLGALGVLVTLDLSGLGIPTAPDAGASSAAGARVP